MTKPAALHNFWSRFLPSYDENTVPTGEDAPAFPYLTYNATSDSFEHPVPLHASLWYRSPSWVEIEEKAKEISEAIGLGGEILPVDGGYVWILRGSPFAQRMSEPEDDTIRRMYINISVEFLTAN